MKKLVEDLKQLEDLIIRCMKCGTCQAHCPLYKKDLFEGSVARGKISLLESIYEGKIENVETVLKYLDYCILCGRCETNCPSGVKTVEIFLKGKSILREVKDLPVYQKVLLEILLGKPELMSRFAPLFHMGFKLGTKKVKDDIYKPIFKGIGERFTKGIKKRFFTGEYGGENRAENEKMKVIFYPGCAINMIYFEWGEKIVKLLNKLGVTVIVPEVNYCCGIPAATMGKQEMMKALLEKNYEYFEKYDTEYVITACPTCNHSLADLGENLGLEVPDKKFMDILIFLDKVLDIRLSSITDKKVTLHIPCHYDKDFVDDMTEYVASISSDFVSLENQSCCGFGGTFNLKNYDKSVVFSVDKAKEVESKEIEILFTPCPGCAINLTDGVMHVNANCKVLHPVEVIYEVIAEDVSKDQAKKN
ncbi:(Fe-S)-binding protein [Deferribacter autotrophicus]|uniref:Glycolate oxidase iron-sulfur subunit n=1 Tax=Deferribacter autotrophicus TaxID=500465 RepID=A0A5A8F8B4_9BACT|nr:(Fe-S)-binding protein [Deferribacter autotrophicus]KAA0259528.1 (Fe-S)-binding protein [Deferribacter autotrophicus]